LIEIAIFKEIANFIIDEEEFDLIKQIKELKKEYKEGASKIKDLKSEIIVTD